MTADERIESLLNRAGQTINDLPTWGGNVRRLEQAKREALTEMGCRWTDYPGMSEAEAQLLEYILKLAGIIDRMETALENVIGERDWLRANYSANPNETVPEDWEADDADD